MQNFYPGAYLCTALLTSLMLTTSEARGEAADWQIDPEHFSIAFAADHIGFQQQLGMFLEASGSFRYDPEAKALSSGRVEVQAESVFSNHEARDNHLRSDDFLDVENHPVIIFEATDYTPRDDDGDGNGAEEHGTLTGNLTLLGNTRPVELTVTINKRARYPFGHRRETLGISASTTLLRSQWGMDYAVANNLVGDEVTLRFEFEALRQ
jgi:polyisoprenoid-binding protein YceI